MLTMHMHVLSAHAHLYVCVGKGRQQHMSQYMNVACHVYANGTYDPLLQENSIPGIVCILLERKPLPAIVFYESN